MSSASGIFTTGSNLDIDTSAEHLTTARIICAFGVLIKADDDNSGDIYVGPKGVTKGTAQATDGIRLKPGDGVFIEIDDTYKIYVIGSAANQKAWFVAT